MIAYLSEPHEKQVQSSFLMEYRKVVEENRCNQRGQAQRTIRSSYRRSPTWLCGLAKRWERPRRWQQQFPGSRSTETPFRRRRILVLMSRVCLSFHKGRSASTWAGRVMSLAKPRFY